MWKYILPALLITGCCDESPTPTTPATNGYHTVNAKIIRKYELFGPGLFERRVDIKVDGTIIPTIAPDPDKMSDEDYAAIEEGATMSVTYENKPNRHTCNKSKTRNYLWRASAAR